MNPKPLTKLFLCLFILASIVSCKKSSDTDSSTTVPTGCGTNPYKVGTVATYSTSSGSYTVTCPSSSTISGKNYIKSQTSTAPANASYIYVDTNGDIWNFVPAVAGADVAATEMIVSKVGKAVGDTWSYSFPSIAAPSMISYKYTYTVLANNISFTLAGKTYTNCMKVKTVLETFLNGASMGSSGQYSTATWGCGIGLVGSEVNGATYSTLTSYVY